MLHPIIHVGIALAPPAVKLGAPCDLTVTATLSSTYPRPVTVYTWPTIFNVSFALQRKNFFCSDLSDNNTSVHLEITKGGRRSGFISRKLGSPDDKDFHTLEPGQTVEFTTPFHIAAPDRRLLTPGHRYQFGIKEGETVHRWLQGTRAEVLAAPGEEEPSHNDWRRERIELILPEPVEFEVVAPENPENARSLGS